jgi:TRAP-type C4-dicarboxylate transport system permease large subunit
MLSTYLGLGYAGIAVVVFSVAVFLMFRDIKKGETKAEEAGWRVVLYAMWSAVWGMIAGFIIIVGAILVLTYPFTVLAKRLAPKEVPVEVSA